MTERGLAPTVDQGHPLFASQEAAVAAFSGFPTKKHTNWMYWNPDEDAQKALLSPVLTESQAVTESDSIQLRNGRLISTVNLTGLSVSNSYDQPVSSQCETSPIASLATALCSETVSLTLSESIESVINLRVSAETSSLDQSVPTRLLLHAKAGTTATISVSHDTQSGISNTVMDVICEEGATLTVNHVFESEDALQFFTASIHCHKESHYTQTSVVQDGNVTRQDTELNFHESGAEAELNGLALLSGSSQYYNHLKVNHHVGGCNCHQFFKSIVTDKAITEFSGLVFVEEKAHETESHQLNQNLLLSDDGRVYSRPQLRIDADDVQCDHGSTIGQLNPTEVHYIRSRGLNHADATALLTFGFAEEVIDKIEDKTLHQSLKLRLQDVIPRYLTHVQ